jgi:hypothetical protein
MAWGITTKLIGREHPLSETPKPITQTETKATVGFEQRLETVINEVLDVKFKALDLRIDKMIEEKLNYYY